MTDLVDDLEPWSRRPAPPWRRCSSGTGRCPPTDSSGPAGGTVEHTADDLFAYAAQIVAGGVRRTTPRAVRMPSPTPAGDDLHRPRRAGAGNAGLVQVLDASGGMLSPLPGRPPRRPRGGHPYGLSDPHGFAAMGTVETLLHLHDVAGPLGIAWDPDPDVVRRVLDRLFPDGADRRRPVADAAAAHGTRPAAPLESWRWDSRVPADRS